VVEERLLAPRDDEQPPMAPHFKGDGESVIFVVHWAAMRRSQQGRYVGPEKTELTKLDWEGTFPRESQKNSRPSPPRASRNLCTTRRQSRRRARSGIRCRNFSERARWWTTSACARLPSRQADPIPDRVTSPDGFKDQVGAPAEHGGVAVVRARQRQQQHDATAFMVFLAGATGRGRSRVVGFLAGPLLPGTSLKKAAYRTSMPRA